MEKKKKKNPVIRILLFLFIIYSALFIANATGYYETKIRKSTTLTEEGIKDFEELINSGSALSLEAFLKEEKVDYSNTLSNLGENLTYTLEQFISGSAKRVSKIINTLF